MDKKQELIDLCNDISGIAAMFTEHYTGDKYVFRIILRPEYKELLEGIKLVGNIKQDSDKFPLKAPVVYLEEFPQSKIQTAFGSFIPEFDDSLPPGWKFLMAPYK